MARRFRLIRVLRWLVPRARRDEWTREWEAELFHHQAQHDRRRPFGVHASVTRRSISAIWDVLWLQANHAHTLRFLARHWPLSSVAVLSLGAAFATVFVGLGIFNAVVWRAPGVSKPDELVTLWARTPQEEHGLLSYPEYRHYRDHNAVFVDVAAIPQRIQNVSVIDGDQRWTATVSFGSNNLFNVLGIRAEIGRLEFPADAGTPIATAILSHGMWTRLGADPSLVGRTVQIQRHPVQIIGIAPRQFGGMMLVFGPDLWMPLQAMQTINGESMTALERRDERSLVVVGRLRRGVSREQAEANVAVMSAELATAFPATDADRHALLTPLQVIWADTRADVVPIAALLMSGLLIALVAAAANVTNVLSSLAVLRRQDLVVRVALGASATRLMRQLVSESVIISAAAGVVGLVVASVGMAALSAARPQISGLPPIAVDVSPDGRVLAIVVGVVLVVGVLTGVLPAFQATWEAMRGALNRRAAFGTPRAARLRQALVVVQVAAVTMVLVGVGWSLRSVTGLQRVEPGFGARRLLAVDFSPEANRYESRDTQRFIDDVRRRAAALPGVEAITIADGMPLGLTGWGTDRVRPDPSPNPREALAEIPISVVDMAFFSTLQITRVQGRLFDTSDTGRSPEVIVVNQTLARRFWPDRDPVGQRLFIEHGGRRVTVVGVVADGRYSSLDEAQSPFMYFALAQHPDALQSSLSVIARTADPEERSTVPLAQVIRAIDPDLEFQTFTLEDRLRDALQLPLLTLAAVAGFGMLALILAETGLFGALFHSVSQRRQEMGIRVALGASPRDLFRLVLTLTAALTGLGAAAGIGLALVVLPFVSSLFFGISAFDPLVGAGVVAATGCLAMGAAYAAAWPWMRTGAVQLMGRSFRG